MQQKTINWLLLGLLVVVTIGVVLVKGRKEVRDPLLGTNLLPAAMSVQVNGIIISKEGRKVVLRREAGDAWFVKEPEQFPADARRISEFIEAAVKTKIDRKVASSSADPKEYGLSPGTSLRLEFAGSDAREFVFGDSDASSGGQFLRFEKDEAVYSLSSALAVSLDNEQWLYKVLVQIPKKEVLSVEIAQGKNLRELAICARKKVEDKFEVLPAAGKITVQHCETLLGYLENLSFGKKRAINDPEAAAALSTPIRKLVVSLSTGVKYTLITGSSLKESPELFFVSLLGESVGAQAPAGKEAAALERLRDYATKFRFAVAGTAAKPVP